VAGVREQCEGVSTWQYEFCLSERRGRQGVGKLCLFLDGLAWCNQVQSCCYIFVSRQFLSSPTPSRFKYVQTSALTSTASVTFKCDCHLAKNLRCAATPAIDKRVYHLTVFQSHKTLSRSLSVVSHASFCSATMLSDDDLVEHDPTRTALHFRGCRAKALYLSDKDDHKSRKSSSDNQTPASPQHVSDSVDDPPVIVELVAIPRPRTRSERTADTHHSLPSSTLYSSTSSTTRIGDLPNRLSGWFHHTFSTSSTDLSALLSPIPAVVVGRREERARMRCLWLQNTERAIWTRR
jgi:hypothetical protein